MAICESLHEERGALSIQYGQTQTYAHAAGERDWVRSRFVGLSIRHREVLHWVAKHGPPKSMQMLIVKKADINAVDGWGRTPLMWAVESRQSAVVNMLLKTGANVEWKAKDGSTVLPLAAYNGHGELVHQLLEKSANVEARTRGWIYGTTHGCIHGLCGSGEAAPQGRRRRRGTNQWPGTGVDSEDGKNDDSHEDYWQDESGDDDWQDSRYGSDSQDTDDDVHDAGDSDNEDGGQFDLGKFHRMALSLSKQLRQLLLEQEVVTDVKAKARNWLTVKQLAVSDGNVAVQRLLAQY
jgi:hypothetical protein